MKKNTPKRRLASTRNMSKQDKRRVQLHKTTKNKTEQKTRSGRVMFSRPDGSSLFVRGNRSDAAVKTPLNKRLIALVLAIVMILALIPAGIFMLRPKAAGTTPMESTPMTVRINGKSSGTAMIQPGSIAENIAENDIDYGEVVIPSGAEFVKAVLVDENNIETQIYSVASKGDTNYYSIAQDAYTGVAKDQDEELVLVFANKYYIDFGTARMNENGFFENAGVTFTTNATPEVNVDSNETKYFIYGGQDLEIKEIKAKLDKSLGKVEYSTGSNAGAETIKNSRVTIPSNMYDGEIHVQVNYGELDEYTVQDARYMANSKYYAQYAKLDNHGGTSLSSTAKGTTNSLGTVDKGQTKTFYVFSQLNSTSSQVWRLSMLSLNGTDLTFPTDTETVAKTNVRDFGDVEVRYMGDLNMDGESKTRAVYEIKVPNVHENVEVNYYFTNIKERQLIIKGLNGINKTAASVENKMISGNLTGKWYTYTEDKLNVYDAFYDSRKNFPADNLVLYTVKPGYNPYAISTTLFADGEDVTNKIRATNATGTPLEVISQAGNAEDGNFDTDWRYWGENNGELHNTDKKHWGDELLLTTIKKDKDNTWYAVALAQSKKTNQQLVLNAPEYKYAIEVDLNGGDLTATGYTTASGLMNEDVTHTIADASPFMFLPAGTPTQAGKIFAGYRLVNIDSETGNLKDSYADDNKYMPSDRINIDSTALDYAYGNRKDPNNGTLKIRFKAIWKDGKNTTNVNVTTQYQTGVNEDGSPNYGTTAFSITEASTVGDAAVLNDHLIDGSGNALAKNKYYALSSDSVIVGNTSDNFVVKYDYNLLDLTVKKTVLGYPKTKRFPITVKLTPHADSPVSVDDLLLVLNKENTYATVNEENTEITYVRNIQDGETFAVSVPYNWDYTVTEPTVAKDYTNDIDPNHGTMTKNTVVDVTNIDDSSVVGTNKTIAYDEASGTYTLTLDSWATGQSFTKPKSSTTPLDIALVIDQSGSMATGDMSIRYDPVEVSEGVSKTQWFIDDFTSGEQYYYFDGNNYYPVYAKKGPLYYQVKDNPPVYRMFGSGHDEFVLQDLSVHAKLHFNVPTDYYCIGTDGKMHKIWFVTAGAFARYHAYPYYYYNEDEIYIPTTTDGLNKGYGDDSNWWIIDGGPEWRTEVGYLDTSFGADNWMKANYSSILNKYNSNYISDSRIWGVNGTGYMGVEPWVWLCYNHKIGLVGQTGTTITNVNNVHMSYSWLGPGNPLSATLYKTVDGTTYNELYYIDSTGAEQTLNTITFESDQMYDKPLYKATGKSRLSVLTKATQDFADVVAKNAADSGADHRIAIVGFAGNQVPALSTANGIYHSSGLNDKWDYVNTGLFVPSDDNTSSSFKSYKEITSFRKLADSETAYGNYHYFIDSDFGKVPVVYRNEKWVRVDTGASVTRSTSTPFYEAQYNDLDANNHYGKALVSASKREDGVFTGEVADSITSAINQFGDYGGTYTSYGMTMAKEVFDKNSSVDEKGAARKRIVIVFTDGEPGASGYDSAIAGEALVDSSALKANGVDVYTIGLFPGTTKPDVEEFMSLLSSEYQQTTEKVYAGNANYGLGSKLDKDATYYFEDDSATDKKVYAVTAKKDGKDTLGWWATDNNNSYWPVVPTPYNPLDSTPRDGCVQFYSYDGRTYTKVYQGESGFSLTANNYYYKDSDNNYYPVRYEYRWYDSNNLVRIPKTSSASDGVQFLKLNDPTDPKSENTYYYKASNASLLESYFNQIAESISSSTTNIPINGQNSMMQDIITSNFDARDAGYTVEKVAAKMTDGVVSPISGTEASSAIITGDVTVVFDKVNPNDEENPESTITVTGFDYGSEDNYISENHNGNLMRVTITGLKPNKTGFDLPSNTNESGVYEVLTKEPTGEKKILDDFDLPEVDRPTYSLSVSGDDRNTQYSVTFQLLKNGEASKDSIPTQYVLKDGIKESVSFSDGKYVWTTSVAPNEQTIVFEDFPDGYDLQAIVTKLEGDMSTQGYYDYSVKVDGKIQTDEEGTPITFDKPLSLNNESTIQITSMRHKVAVTLREQTLQSDDTEGGNADPDKLFDIQLKLTREDGSDLGEAVTYSGVEFDTEGNATIQMKHDQVRTLDLPEGFKLAIDVDPDSQDLYLDTYTKGTTINDGAAYGTDKYPATGIVNGQYITIFNKIDFPLPTGMFDNKVPVSVILLAVAGVLGLAAAGAYVYRRKRRLNDR